jgi:hypothetical protein
MPTCSTVLCVAECAVSVALFAALVTCLISLFVLQRLSLFPGLVIAVLTLLILFAALIFFSMSCTERRRQRHFLRT